MLELPASRLLGFIQLSVVSIWIFTASRQNTLRDITAGRQWALRIKKRGFKTMHILALCSYMSLMYFCNPI